MRARTWAEVATLLRMWDACVRWADIGQRRPKAGKGKDQAKGQAGDVVVEVVGRRAAHAQRAQGCEYLVRRGASEAWEADASVMELYAVRAYEEKQAAAAEAAERARAEVLETERQRRLLAMRAQAPQQALQGGGPLAPGPQAQRFAVIGQPLGSLSHGSYLRAYPYPAVMAMPMPSPFYRPYVYPYAAVPMAPVPATHVAPNGVVMPVSTSPLSTLAAAADAAAEEARRVWGMP
jgi:hypothetical protein